MSSGEQLPSLSEHLQRQHVALGTFVDVLKHEQALLGSASISLDELGQTTEQKRELADTLEVLETRRQRINAASGYAGDADSSRALAERESCLDLWDSFMVRVENARAHNNAVGSAIEAHLGLTNETLAFLRQNADDSLYTPNGQKQANTPNETRSNA